jgi:hypothetical protein
MIDKTERDCTNLVHAAVQSTRVSHGLVPQAMCAISIAARPASVLHE